MSVTNEAPVLDAIPDQSILVGETLSLVAVASDPDGDTPTYSLDQSPAGMTIDPGSGAIGWTPGAGDVGVHDVT